MESNVLVRHLLQPSSYPHPVESVELRETHISWVFLTGQHAYKLKKPLDLGFANFTTLLDRKRFCLEEVRRNQLYSPGIYLDVIPIGTDDHVVQVGGSGAPIDFLVHMKQFDDSQLAGQLATSRQLTQEDLSGLAQVVAGFHQTDRKSVV